LTCRRTHILDRRYGRLPAREPALGARDRLDAGVLALYLVHGTVDERHGRRFAIDTPAGRLDAAIDGEPEVLTTPIEFRVEPLALRLLVPPRR
jgi:hypothetical protein